MPAKKYFEGQYIGPYNILFVKELKEKKNRQRIGIFQCPFCSKLFDAKVCRIGEGKTRSCGCERIKQAIVNGKGRIINIVGQRFGKLIVLGQTDMRSTDNRILWKCQCDCGNIHYATASDLKRGKVKSCGCLISAGEEKISRILTAMNISFVTQKIFKDCINPKTKNKLRFNFYLPKYNCCIEYDGIHHYKNIPIYKDSVDDLNYRDNIKTEYCKNNHILLIRISCFDFDKINEEYITNLLS